MDTFVWDTRYGTGLDEVDAQHKRLVSLINRYGEAYADGGLAALDGLIDNLVEFAIYHFAAEMEIMQNESIDTRHRDRHDATHAMFVSQVGLFRDWSRQDPAGAQVALLEFLTRWLSHHFQCEDRAMAEQVRAIRAGASPEFAYRQSNREDSSSVEVLVATMQGLYDQLAKRSAALIQAKEELESRVAARTRELADANLRLQAEHDAQQALILKLEDAQAQLVQSEKLASIGQLAAGVAHEINNPVGFVNSNLGSLSDYVEKLVRLLDGYRELCRIAPPVELAARAAALEADIDLEFLRQDVRDLLAESLEGLGRVKRIVQDLRDFSRVDQEGRQDNDLNQGLENTLNVVWNEVKYKADVVRKLQPLPPVPCDGAQINQVFMNLLVNAAQAIEGRGEIRLANGIEGAEVWVEVADTGRGMSEAVKRRIFEPFYTTKPVGKGTGLGLSVSYNIMKKHGGRITVRSAPGKGSAFRVWLPLAPVPVQATDAQYQCGEGNGSAHK